MPQPSYGQDYYKKPKAESSSMVSRSSLDYTNVATQITEGCQDNLQKIRAIYKWICRNIAFDTTRRIRTADVCIETGYGLCQAYCELFYQLARAVGVRVEVIYGMSKNADGEINPKGHSWLFAYTTEDRGILLDPTWGAGSVNNGFFSWSKDPWLWFNVDPDWFVLSHWTKDAADQLVERPMTEKEFRRASPVNELWMEYGLNIQELARQARAGTLKMPKFYSQGAGIFHALDIPFRSSLKIGEFYNFRIRVTPGQTFILDNNSARCPKEEWTQEDDSTYSIRFMPRDTSNVFIILHAASGNDWYEVLSYQTEPPTGADWKRVEEAYPLSAPEMKKLENYTAERWDSTGLDAHKLLGIVREQHITKLPTLFFNEGQRLTIKTVPMNYTLKAGEPYTFSFRPHSGINWALFNNNKWHNDWQIGENNLHTMTLSFVKGSLNLSVQMEEGDSYLECLRYEVE